jgi:hypothetical protein
MIIQYNSQMEASFEDYSDQEFYLNGNLIRPEWY